MRTRQALVVGTLVSVAAVTAVLAVRSARTHQQEAARGEYYCPMHPSYTSDRPGDCRICNMRLVRRKPEGAARTHPKPGLTAQGSQGAQAQETPSSQARSICYLHHCPELHEGRPCPMTVVAAPGEAVTCPVCGTHIAEASGSSGGGKVLYWTDPMIPGYRAERPGKSPMGMDLVPVYEEQAARSASAQAEAPAGYAPVLLTPRKQQVIGVRTALARKRPLTKTIRTVGVIAHDPELYQAQQELIQAEEAWRRAQATDDAELIERGRRLVESSRFRLRHLGLSDPLIEEIGAWTKPDHRLLLGGAGQYWVYASIYEYELPLVRAGQAATITTAALPGRAFDSTVKAIDRMLDPATRTARTRIVAQDPEGLLKPEMYVDVSVVVDLGEALAVPEEAVFATGEKHLVFVDRGEGLFEPRDVTVGMRADDAREIRAGVSEGEAVVISGNFLIDSESRLQGALQNLGGAEHRHGQ